MYEVLVEEFLYYGKVFLARQDKPSHAESIQFLEQAFEVCSDGISAVAAASRDGNEDEDMLGKVGKETLALNNLKFKVLRFLTAGHLQNDNSADFYEILPDTLENLEMKRASMLLAVGATLAGNRDDTESHAVLKVAVLYLEKCWKIHEIAKSKSKSAAKNDSMEIYLNLLSFEVKRRMKDHKAQLEIICHCSTLTGFQPKLFYSMGMSGGESQDVEVSMAAFEACLNVTLASPKPDYALVAATMRKMISVADTVRRDSPRAMNLYKQAHQILLGLDVGVYPKEEVQWLISTAWNRASLHVKFNRFSLAEKWMNLALDMLKHAPAMESFRPVMLDNLSSVLKRKADEPSFVDD